MAIPEPNRSRRRRTMAVRAAVAACLAGIVVVALAGCAAGPSVEERIEERIIELSDAVDDARVTLHKDIFVQKVILELFVSEQTDDNLAAAVEAGYEGAWRAADFEPTGVSVRVSDAPLTEERHDQDATDYVSLDALEERVYGCRENSCSRLGSGLEYEFGPWGEQ